MASIPSAVRQRSTILPTPLVGDVLFSERVVNQTRNVPAYGTAHPNATRWPNHKFVFARERQEPEAQDVYDYFYAADRENQDLYNFSHTEADIGGTRFDAVARTYVIPRASFTPNTPAMGAAMPNVPVDLFHGSHVLAEKRQTRIGDQELDSLYVAETRVYVKRATISAVKMNDETGRVKKSVTNLYYRGETVSGTPVETLATNPSNAYWGQQADGTFRELDQLSENWFAIIESNVIPDDSVNSASNPAKTRIQNRVTPLGTDILFTETGAMPSPIPAYGSAHYDSTNWPNHVLALIEPADASGLLFRFTYVADRSSQDEYNFEFSKADIGGQKFDSVTRTYVTPRADFVETSLSMGAIMPDVPAAAFGAGYILAEQQQRKIGEPALDSLYVAEVLTYVRKVTLGEIGYNENTGRSSTSAVTLYYSSETVSGGSSADTLFADKDNTYWGLQTDGTFRTIQQLSDNWYAVTERSVLPESPENGSSNPAKTRIQNRVTPLGTDIYFTETGSMPDPVPSYGSAHYDTTNWPNHKLSFISPADASGLLFKFHYVADRANQDEYNFTSAQADIGGRKFDSVERTYLEPRATFVEAAVAMGATMPDVPSAAFGVGYVLAMEEQGRTGDPQFDNLYVTITRTYVRKVTLGSIGYDETTGRSNSSTVTLRYTGEVTSGSDTIDALFADKDNAYWGLQTDGTFRTCEKITDNWFAVEVRSVLPESPENGSSNPAKTRIQNRVTPLGTDIYFTETGSMPSPAPSYGAAHYDAANWPNHKLSLITAADRSGKLFTFHYVADRANQDSYNFNFTKADIGGTRFDAVTRTYVTLRSAFTPNTPAMGAAMPNTPAGLFTGSYVLARREERRVGDPVLDGLFVAEELTYVKRCTIRDIGVDPVNGKSLVSSETLHYATETIIPGVTEPQSLTVSGTLTPDAAGTLDRVEDLSGFPQFSTAINGTTYPATRVYYNGTAWVLSYHPNPTLVPYALWTSAVCTLEECPSPSDATGWAPLLGVGLATPTGTPTITDTTPYTADITTSALFDAPTNAYWGLQTDGTQRSGKQLSCEWYLIESRQVVGGTFAEGVVTVDTFSTNDNYFWPPVLDTYELLDWDRRDGGTDIFPAVRFDPEGYNGPCKTVVTRTWSRTPFTINAVQILQPSRIYYAAPFYTANIPECLHGVVAFQCDTGNNDPVYEQNVGSTRYFSATGPEASGDDAANKWPATITAYDDQVPFRGGYLRTVRVVHRPTIPTQVGWTTGT